MELNIVKSQVLLNTVHYVAQKATQKYFKNGVELEKGAIITQKRIEKHRKLYERYCEFWSTYPDLFLDCIKREDLNFNLFFYQRFN